MKLLATVAALVLGLVLGACGDDEPDADGATDPDGPRIGRNAPNVITDGDGRRAGRQELERPIEGDGVNRVRCPSQVALGEGARFTCGYSDPELGTGAVVVEQVDSAGTLEYESAPRSSTEFDGSFTGPP
jgi:hypothetical protein